MMRPVILVFTALALAACSSDPAPEETVDDDARTAEGEVLGGTISDAMLPLDTLGANDPRPEPAATEAGEGESEATEPEPDQEAEAE